MSCTQINPIWTNWFRLWIVVVHCPGVLVFWLNHFVRLGLTVRHPVYFASRCTHFLCFYFFFNWVHSRFYITLFRKKMFLLLYPVEKKYKVSSSRNEGKFTVQDVTCRTTTRFINDVMYPPLVYRISIVLLVMNPVFVNLKNETVLFCLYIYILSFSSLD